MAALIKTSGNLWVRKGSRVNKYKCELIIVLTLLTICPTSSTKALWFVENVKLVANPPRRTGDLRLSV
jgi:hypothetical protein